MNVYYIDLINSVCYNYKKEVEKEVVIMSDFLNTLYDEKSIIFIFYIENERIIAIRRNIEKYSPDVQENMLYIMKILPKIM